MTTRIVVLASLVLTLVGCTSHNTTLVRGEAASVQQVIYRVSEEQAFRIVVDAFAEILPKQSLYDITGPRRGYQATWRFGLDTYSQKVLVIPAIATDAGGREVRGYWFDVSGSGSSGSGYRRNLALYHRIQEALEATGTATVVTGVRDGRYDTTEHAYRAGGRDASEAAALHAKSKPAGPPAVADQLRELKALHDQGLISKDEYEAKRRQILDRM